MPSSLLSFLWSEAKLALPSLMSSRAALKPFWKLDRRLRTRSGETGGAGGALLGAAAVAAEPGTRLALGTR